MRRQNENVAGKKSNPFSFKMCHNATQWMMADHGIEVQYTDTKREYEKVFMTLNKKRGN